MDRLTLWCAFQLEPVSNRSNKHFTFIEFLVHSASYDTLFFPLQFMAHLLCAWIINNYWRGKNTHDLYLTVKPLNSVSKGIYNIPRLQLHNPPIPNSTNCSFSSVSMSGKKINLSSHQETFGVADSLHIKYKELSSQGLIWDGFNNEHVSVKKKLIQKFTLSSLNRNPQ